MVAMPVALAEDTITLRLDDGAPAKVVQPTRIEPPPQAEPTATPCAPMLGIQPNVKAACAVLIDSNSGQILYGKNEHARRPNASTTKIMTAILLIERCDMADTITVSKNACLTPFTSLNLKPGEKISVKDLLTGMMVRSANDAAVAAAEHISGSVSAFSKLMNQKAVEIGCKDTHFVTPNGLYNANHYSSAYDLALMARYALRYPMFNEAVNTRKYTLATRTINKKDMVVFNKSKFLKNYVGADGVKSGYVKQAGYCYVGSATRCGWRLISAVLKSDNASRDTEAVMDYGFATFKPVTLARTSDGFRRAPIRGGTEDVIVAVPTRDLRVAVSRSGGSVTTRVKLIDVEAPIAKGAGLGTITAVVNGADVASVGLCASKEVGVSLARRATWWLKTCSVLTLCVVVGSKYGTAFTKNTRRRRRRVTASLRNFDRYR